MKKFILVLISITPLFVGYLLNHLMMKYDIYGFKVDLYSAVFYAYWFYFGYVSVKLSKSVKEAILLANSIGIICMSLVIGQFLIIGHFSSGYLGSMPQMYFLPSLSIAARLDIMNIFNNSISFISLGFVLMNLVFFLGYKSSKKNVYS